MAQAGSGQSNCGCTYEPSLVVATYLGTDSTHHRQSPITSQLDLCVPTQQHNRKNGMWEDTTTAETSKPNAESARPQKSLEGGATGRAVNISKMSSSRRPEAGSGGCHSCCPPAAIFGQV
ncbi:hypothetical protein GGTG_03707 [Gaeumannomyces tritici R3-111a-1]|uniref:Uncharacterized protein n=1 Tax=Gaeumannomyces tritici (strain R3-111a-1) TaxID=644352 RepID=J3NR02_GAET3|nr:hypothetical protein GGTG_03707 [Gaeumannomyces tritici R3-111a-1]EJT78608.1 hypothetical protein GGTG_03707 [Gaeumannomyces tritici R3-111a-1]